MKVKLLKTGQHETHQPPSERYLAEVKPICSSVTLIKAEQEGEHNIIVDTGSRGNRDTVITALQKEGLNPEDIEYVINTHEHFDHCGNNAIFANAIIIADKLEWYPDAKVRAYRSHEDIHIQDGVSVIHTPGHKMNHCSVVVEADQTYVIAGDTIARKFFLAPYEFSTKLDSAEKVLGIADTIIPGHGEPIEKEEFDTIREKIRKIKGV